MDKNTKTALWGAGIIGGAFLLSKVLVPPGDGGGNNGELTITNLSFVRPYQVGGTIHPEILASIANDSGADIMGRVLKFHARIDAASQGVLTYSEELLPPINLQAGMAFDLDYTCVAASIPGQSPNPFSQLNRVTIWLEDTLTKTLSPTYAINY
jgi:hypothetical protein